MEQVILRRAGDKDLKQVQKLIGKSFLPESDDATYTKILKSYLNDQFVNKLVFLFELEGKAIGMVIAHPWVMVPKPKKLKRVYWHISNFYLFPKFRGKGYGEQSLILVREEAKKQGVEKMLVYAGHDIAAFFERNGFYNQDTLLEYKV